MSGFWIAGLTWLTLLLIMLIVTHEGDCCCLGCGKTYRAKASNSMFPTMFHSWACEQEWNESMHRRAA